MTQISLMWSDPCMHIASVLVTYIELATYDHLCI